jgi:hypothetical protein
LLIKNSIHFPISDFLETNYDELSSNVFENIKEHLDLLALKLREYFPSCSENNNWMKTPFLVTKLFARQSRRGAVRIIV